MNEKGSSTFLAMVLLFIFSLLSITYIKNRIDTSKKIQFKQNLLICTKYVNGETKQYIKRINYSNKILKYITMGKYATLVTRFTPLTFLLGKSAKFAEKSLKSYQKYEKISFLKNLNQLPYKSCKLSPRFALTPFKSRRDHLNRLTARGLQWKLHTKSGSFLTISKFQLKSGRVKTKMRKVNLLSLFR